MATVLNVPPTEDFTGYQGLVAKQAEHFASMVTWAGNECVNTTGMDGIILSLAKPLVPPPAHYVSGLLSKCQTGMGTIKDKIATVDKELRTQDESNATDLKNVFPDQISGLGSNVSLPTLSSETTNFDDEAVTLKEPTETESSPTSQVSAPKLKSSVISLHKKNKKNKNSKDSKDSEDSKDSDSSDDSSDGDSSDSSSSSSYLSSLAGEHIKKYTEYLEKKKSGSGTVIWLAEKGYKMVTGHSLIDAIFKPIVGDWDRLSYLHDAYDTLGDGCYTVAGTLRKASWKIGSEWKGDTASAFDIYMFRWTMGIGGIGDLAKVIAKAYKTAHDELLKLIGKLVDKIGDLIDKGITTLAAKIAKMLAVDAAIEVVGGGPEDPLADIAVLAYDAKQMYEIYKLVREVVKDVITIVELYNKIKTVIETLKSSVEKAYSSFSGPMPTVGSVISDVETKGFDFEKSGSWNSTTGVARIAILPSA
ncbi:hypothetical protein [Nocardia macrotermitis]|uniref:Uncharacterized protein n=1 Tax=Nocardia macrotermitis TaxID=2585198 RepID=A0A7K0CZZ5_9NOCA|nr:hypothetical protein [Nocardia macrotermitis]MQY19043.1 hypothetical protein [Nocardia macrotermitis]